MAPPTTLKDTRVKRFSPMSVSDSLDATEEFPGACSSLTNLVPDLTTRNMWTCRPAATKIMSFSACPNLTAGHTVGAVSVMKVIGNFVYGMVEDTTVGFDFCFAYNLAASAWVTVTPVSGTLPKALATISAPAFLPTIDLIGVYLCVTHPGYSSTSDFFGYFDITNPSSPSFTSGDLTSGGAYTFSSLGSIPTWVKQFNGRAYFGVNGAANGTGTLAQPTVIATDDLALKVTNAGQALTFGDALALTAAAPLGLSNQLGGIIQALMVFKGVTNIYQVTGDYALSNWTVNTLNVATGTFASRSICSTPLGLAFLSPAGLRIIDQNATISDPIGIAGKGVNYPLTLAGGQTAGQAFVVAAGCDGVTIKLSVLVNFISVEYWYNLPRKVWSGPHSPFTSSIFDVYNGQFISVPDPNYDNNIYYSPTDPTNGSTFTESSALTFTMQSAQLEDNQQMAASEVAETQLVTECTTIQTLTMNFVDSQGTVINTSNVVVNVTGLRAYHVDFPALSVFNRMAIQITGNSAAGFKLGDTFLRLRTLSYLPPPP